MLKNVVITNSCILHATAVKIHGLENSGDTQNGISYDDNATDFIAGKHEIKPHRQNQQTTEANSNKDDANQQEEDKQEEGR